MIADGIYLGMGDDVYHGDTSLGSTGIKRLLQSAPDYWWESPLNPLKEEKETDSLAFGKAVHRCILDGRERFESEYAPAYLNGSTKEGKAERAAIKAQSKKPIKGADYERILVSASFIKANPHLAKAFDGGIPEVSVFWTRKDGVRVKARFDYLKMSAISDLKSIRNPLGKEFAKACRDAVATYDYTISAAHYCEGRRQMVKLMQEGHVFGATEAETEWLWKVARNETFAFVLVFYQAEGAPISHGFQLSPENPLLGAAKQAIEQAIHNYKTYLAQFGQDTAWVLAEPLEELDETTLPAWYQYKQATKG